MIHDPVESYGKNGKMHRTRGAKEDLEQKHALDGALVGQHVYTFFCQVWVCAGAAAGTTWLFGCPNSDAKVGQWGASAVQSSRHQNEIAAPLGL